MTRTAGMPRTVTPYTAPLRNGPLDAVTRTSVALALVILLAGALPARSAGLIPLVQDKGNQLQAGVPQPAAVLEAEFRSPTTGLGHLLADLVPGTPRTLGPVTIFPLLAQHPASPAVAMGPAGPPTAAHADDTAAGYQVLGHSGPQVQLALLGQILQGDKTQDRLMERSQLIPPGGKSLVTAYCCEHLFTARPKEALDMTTHLVPGSIRARLAKSYHDECALLNSGGEAERDLGPMQDFVWAEIKKRIVAKGIASPYEAYLDQVPHRPAEIARLAAEPLPRETAGLAIGVGDKLVAVECFGSPALMAPHAAELMASWLDHAPADGEAPEAAAPDAVRQQAVLLLATPPASVALLADAAGSVSVAVSAPAPGLALSVRGQTVHALMVPR